MRLARLEDEPVFRALRGELEQSSLPREVLNGLAEGWLLEIRRKLAALGEPTSKALVDVRRRVWREAASEVERRCRHANFHGHADVCPVCAGHAAALRKEAEW